MSKPLRILFGLGIAGLTVIILLSLVQCSPEPEDPPVVAEPFDYLELGKMRPNTTIYRFIDEQAGVVCWVVTTHPDFYFPGAGISCLPAPDLLRMVD